MYYNRNMSYFVLELIVGDNDMKNKEQRKDQMPIKKAIEDRERRIRKIEEDRLIAVQKFIDRCEYHRYGDDKNGFMDNYRTGTACSNMVGDRIRFILDKENMTVVELAQLSGVSRSTINRCLRQEYPDIPKAETLYKIISKLPCFLDDFLFSPDDIEEWQDAYCGYPIKIGEMYNDYEQLKTFVFAQLSLPLAYTGGERKYVMPPHIIELFSKQIFSAFETADALLDYEKEKTAPKGYIEDKIPMIEMD